MKHAKFLILVVLFAVVALAFVVQATKDSSSLIVMPSELASNPTRKLSRVRVAGRVTQDTIAYDLEPEIRLAFSITNPPPKPGEAPSTGPALQVIYPGLKPDMFAPGRDVLIDGEFENGVLKASKLLTQCPSKYEPPLPEIPKKDESYTNPTTNLSDS